MPLLYSERVDTTSAKGSFQFHASSHITVKRFMYHN